MPAPKVPEHGNLHAACWYSFDWQGEAIFGLLCSPKLIRDRGNFVKKLPNQIHRFDPTFAQHGLNLGSTWANLLPIWAQPGLNLGLTLHRLDPSCWEDLWPKLCSTRAQNEEHGIPNTKR